jgi:hypothetical protein
MKTCRNKIRLQDTQIYGIVHQALHELVKEGRLIIVSHEPQCESAQGEACNCNAVFQRNPAITEEMGLR